MSLYRTGSMASLRVVSSILLILVMSLFGSSVSASTSMVAWTYPMPSAHYHDVGGLSDLLVSRVNSNSNTLVKARQIIQDLSSSSICAHGPTVRLIQQCKNIKPKHDNPTSSHQLSNAESVYAISMALCEARQARVQVPSACRIFEKTLDRPISDAFVEIVRPDEIEACSAVLYGTPGWTSYSTFKSNSKYLCDSSRTDYQQEELLQVLKEATGVIPEILDVLSEHRFEAQVAMTQLRENAASVDSAQREILFRAEEQDRAHSMQLQQLMRHIETLHETMAQAVDENSKSLDLSTEKASAVDTKLTELYATFAEVASGLTFDFEQHTAHLSEEVTTMIRQIQELAAQENLDKIQKTMITVTHSASEMARLQSEQLAESQRVLQTLSDFGLEKLLPKWSVEISSSITDVINFIRVEWTFSSLFGAPAAGFAMFGRGRLAISIGLAYVFTRTLWSYLPSHPEAVVLSSISKFAHRHVTEITYFSVFAAPSVSLATFGFLEQAIGLMSSYAFGRALFAFYTSHKFSIVNTLSHPTFQYVAKYLYGGFVVMFCAMVVVNLADAIAEPPVTTTDEAFEKRTKRDVKQEFERSRRACSVPLDCESA